MNVHGIGVWKNGILVLPGGVHQLKSIVLAFYLESFEECCKQVRVGNVVGALYSYCFQL